MKRLIPVFLILLFACKKEEKQIFYPEYAIEANVIASKPSFKMNGILVNNNSSTFKFKSRHTNDEVSLTLDCDKIVVRDDSYDTTFFRVDYNINSSIVFSDTGYSVGPTSFQSKYILK